MNDSFIGRWFDRLAWVGAAACAVAAVSIGGNAFAQATGIVTTRHNLSSSSAAGNNQVSDTAEVCVFCHTPHGGSTNAPAPLWNKRLRSDGLPANGVGTYTSYATLNTPSLDGIVAPVGSISVACLSCHDGTQAMDNIINAPGSGNVTADGGGDTGLGYTWTGATVDAQGRLNGGPALLGTDLSNDHPIGIQYCGGGLSGSGTTVSGTCRDSDFVLPQTQTVNNNQVFWVETGGTGKQRTDLPLYERNFAGTGGGIGPSVECGSCHDPHVSTGQAGPAGTGRTAGETFLRISNASSAVCTACHVK
jgi:hypothetical protein